MFSHFEPGEQGDNVYASAPYTDSTEDSHQPTDNAVSTGDRLLSNACLLTIYYCRMVSVGVIILVLWLSARCNR